MRGIRIALDAMGTDSHPQPELEAAAQAYQEWRDRVLLVGPEAVLSSRLADVGLDRDQVEIVDAPEVLEMSDKPADSARGKPVSSMAIGVDLVRSGRADAFVTCGNTGGAMANALFRLGRIRGVKRPGLTALFPVRDGRAVVLDIGANTDCKPEYLLQFAVMGCVYADTVMGIAEPRIALLSNGEEAGKGNLLIKEASPMLAASGLNFIGNVEAKEVYLAEADVIVTDGFVGNVFLKTSEAVASFLSDLIKQEITSSAVTSVGGLLARPAFKRVNAILDPAKYGAVPLLGVDGLVFIGHGRFGSEGVLSGIRVARQAAKTQLLDALGEAIASRIAKAPTEASA